MIKDIGLRIHKIHLVLDKDILKFILLSLPLFNVAYFNEVDSVRKIYRLLMLIVIAILFAPDIGEGLRKFKYMYLSILLLVSFPVLVTGVNGGDIKATINNAISIIAVIAVYTYGSKNWGKFIIAQYYLFEFFIYLNLLSEILFPGGLWVEEASGYTKNWLLGYYNTHTIYFIPALLMAYLYYRIQHNHRPVYMTIAILISAFKLDSGGVKGTLLIMMITFVFFKRYWKMFNYFSYWLLQVVFLIVVVFLSNSNFFGEVVEKLFQKKLSFYARVDVWNSAIRYILQSPVWGYGVEDTAQVQEKLGWATHAHNLILQLLYQGGLLYLLLFICLIALAGAKIYKLRKTEIAQVMSIAFLGWAVDTITEPYITPFLVGMFVLAYDCNGINAVCGDKATGMHRIKI